MSRIFPYPLMMASLVVVWLVLTSFSPGQLVVGVAVALLAGQGLAALHPVKPRLRRWDLIPKLVAIVLYDIVRSNIAVARVLILGPDHPKYHSGFVELTLRLRDPNALAVLGGAGGLEVLQFAGSELVGPRRYRLSMLLRGQQGTEDAARAPTPAGSRVVLIDDALLPLPLTQKPT